MIPGSANPLLLKPAEAAAAEGISRSLRFNSSDSAYLSRTPASAGNRKTWTWAGWVKRSDISSQQFLFSASDGAASPNVTVISFDSNQIVFYDYQLTAYTGFLQTTQVFRDPSAWYHLVFVFDSDNATSTDRMRVYVNGSRITTFSSATYPNSGTSSIVNQVSIQHMMGRAVAASLYYFSGYLADVHFIDGQALDPTSFGEFDEDTGIWNPIAYTGSYGTNGFHLDFSDNSSAAALGTDTSGNGNTWTVNNIAVGDNPVYSLNVSGSVASAPYDATKMFDGNLSTYAGHSAINTTITWTRTLLNVTSLRVYIHQGSSTGTVTTTGTGGTQVDTISTDFGPGWHDISLTSTGSTINSIDFARGGSGAFLDIYAIEVNGTILVDGAGAGNDSLVDVPTNGTETDTGLGGEVRGNYAVWNALAKGSDCTLSNGNLDVAWGSAGSTTQGSATFGMSSGKWYWETTITASSASPTNAVLGITTKPFGDSEYPGYSATSWGYRGSDGQKWNNTSGASYGASYANGDVVSVAFDADNGTLTFYKNGSSQGAAFTGLTSGPYFPAIGDQSSSQTFSAATNFGQRPFAYTAPSGFKALCTANLDAPVVTKPSEYMDVALYTGNGGTQTISGLEFSPDLVWIKSRSSGAYYHNVFDTVRGATKAIYTNDTLSEQTNANTLTSFNSDGFSNGSDGAVNGSAITYVAWTWDAGSSTVTNTDGSITSSVRANPSAGFSIVTYTGTGSNATVGHGLNASPNFYVVKRRNAADDWECYHSALGATYYGKLNATDAWTTSGGTSRWNDTEPTSSVFSLGTTDNVNGSGSTYVAYCFAPVDGYSSFGSYTGNGSADGPFVYTGFKPRWVMVKITSSTNSWVIVDSERDTYNVVGQRLRADLSNAEDTQDAVDFVSNGFKIRSSSASAWNDSGQTYIYAAFAENPFQYARAR